MGPKEDSLIFSDLVLHSNSGWSTWRRSYG